MAMLIDAHVHLPSPHVDKSQDFERNFPDVESAVARLRKAGVSGIVFNTVQGVFCDTARDIDTANREALVLHESDPGFYYPGAVVHPEFPELSLKWLAKFRDRGLFWVGELLPYHCGIEFDRDEWTRLFEECGKHGHVVQLHNSPGIVPVARRFPGLKIVCSHITPTWLPELAGCPNIMLDMSGAVAGSRLNAMEDAARHFGTDRLLWGTDFIVYDPDCFKVRACNAFPRHEDREKIFSGNIIRLINSLGGVRAFSR